MMLITKIEVQKQNKNRFHVYVDKGQGEEYGFSVHEDILIQFGLRKGLELDDFDVIEIQYGDKARKAYHKAIEYLGLKMRSKKEVHDFLMKKNVSEHLIQEVLQLLTEKNYINDQEYANAYVRTQIHTNKKGPQLIQKELEEKGINHSSIDAALSQFTKEKQIDLAYKLAEKYNRKTNQLSSAELKRKMEADLLRKGFSFDIIEIVKEMMPVQQSSEEEWEALSKQAEKATRRYASYDRNMLKQKLKQFLYRKGFSVELIDQYLQEIE